MTNNNLIRSYSDRLGRLYSELDDINADIREVEAEAKVLHNINTRELRRWAKAEHKDKVEKLTDDIYAAVQYGSALGHEIGITQNFTSQTSGKVLNNSKVPAHDPETGEIIEPDTERPSTSDKSSPPVAPQGEAGQAETGAGLPVGHEGRNADGVEHADEAALDDGFDSSTPENNRRVEQSVAHLAHNQEVTGSSPVPATSSADVLDANEDDHAGTESREGEGTLPRPQSRASDEVSPDPSEQTAAIDYFHIPEQFDRRKMVV